MSRNRILSIAVALPMVSMVLAAAPAMAVDGSQGVTKNQTPPPPTKEGEAKMGDGIRLHEGISREARSLQMPSSGAAAAAGTGVEGVDVSSWQGANVDWTGLWNAGNRFAYVKATEGGEYKNPYLGSQLPGAQNVGMKAGAYHFALPNKSSGAAQATHFLNNGGRWTADGKTLPGVLDVEWNPYTGTDSCYGMTKDQLSAWIRDFTATYKAATGLDAIVYTSTLWWNQCVGPDAQVSSTNKLWLASYNTTMGALPTGWNTHTIWQYTDKGAIVGDHNNFNGTEADLQQLTVRPEPPVGVVSAASNEAGGSERVRWGDHDGDKRPDYITVADSGEINVWLNHGGDPAGANGWQPVGKIAGGITNDRSRVRLADFDGDGKFDYIVIDPSGAVNVWLNRGGDVGGGWQGIGKVAGGITNDASKVRFADWDGDGKTDYITFSDSGAVGVYLNRGGDVGGGWQATGTVTTGATTDRTRIRFADNDGDGKADYYIVKPGGGIDLFVNRGGDVGGGWKPLGQIAAGLTNDHPKVQFVDFDADTHADYILGDSNGGATVYSWNGGDAAGGWNGLGKVAGGA